MIIKACTPVLGVSNEDIYGYRFTIYPRKIPGSCYTALLDVLRQSAVDLFIDIHTIDFGGVYYFVKHQVQRANEYTPQRTA